MYETKQKILSWAEIDRWVAYWRFLEQRIVFTNGCFDLLHLGHITYLEEAAKLGDVLVVGLNSDESVRRLKGPSRPLQPQEARARILAALEFVEAVIIFEEDTPLRLIEKIAPDVLVKGGDYTIDKVVGADFVRSRGGEVVILPFVQGYSTTALIEKACAC
ncbi:MAG: D-glycero-beta-D-manno-heptose 1-phosphate adenylyltransferase [Bacteroidia bacterium]|nr:D-glycero-beta-D-manno-heptose 1-phosphate adenylyltransferase [Bacteroidia bacterium]MCX7764151.1 D-glycero-beta-D-manno-heptose 1-phosphate adenylyltransferase [Bacteroidia bacterium]MDW8057451.1 D-glycero-beta-D-manno-heptose 1-phosphate adenylyltransferase [Bacteroidia bacterium]